MRGSKASYLLRFDDVCPTLKWSNWEPIEELLVNNDIKPILAIVPDNRDVCLEVEPPNPHFWDRVRAWQAAGWSLGLHGFQHTYVTRDPGLYSNRRASEFAGLPAAVQREKVRLALAILREEGVHSNLWIAPGHSFDHSTVSVLGELGVTRISDGFSVYPYTDSKGMFWIPQQQLSERQILYEHTNGLKRIGVWTVCMHPNAWSKDDIARFANRIGHMRSRIQSVDEIYARYQGRRMDWMDRLNTMKCELRRRARLLLPEPVALGPQVKTPTEVCSTIKT